MARKECLVVDIYSIKVLIFSLAILFDNLKRFTHTSLYGLLNNDSIKF